ncbi:hypothetical protein PMKS-003867 [Pichia membranifaciens]|uniref:Hpc2-related domain-containing protein n=1 Tax=Pichia membranifaciens TaxID=4926 RepID=A0A1Q2YLC7_9ASCO|nr:hypothetical protein PMKS-003867 [Pichia membranifaciens]
MRVSAITDHTRKELSPMSVSNLMNSSNDEPVVYKEPTPPTVVNTAKESPLVPDATGNNKPKRAGRKEPSVVNEMSNSNKKDKGKKTDETDKSNTKDTEPSEPLIITIDIPLSTHNDVHMEHNFAKLVEEKYGQYETQAPFTKGLWNFDGDGDAEGDEEGDAEGDAEEDEEEEDDADLDGDTGPPSGAQTEYEEEDDIVKALQIKFTPGMSDTEKESLVLKEIHRRKMVNNKRIGKYDIDDPFIDDKELEFEEETGANADGWFIWHGKLDVTKKKKNSAPESRIEKPARSGKTSSAGGISGSSRSRHNANSNGDAATTAISTPSGSTSTEKRRKAFDSSVVNSSPAKRSKKTATPSVPNSTTSLTSKASVPAPAPPTTTITATTTATAATTSVPQTTNDLADSSKENNKIIIGSFGFGS